MSDIMDIIETEGLETDLRPNGSIACEEHKDKRGCKAFLISRVKTCPVSAARPNSSEMQVSAQGGQPTAPLPLPRAQGNSHARTVPENPRAHPRMNGAYTACSLLFPSCLQLLSPPASI